MLVSIIQSQSLLAFNGPSANVLSGQRGPRAQHHFNGCHDERVKSEHGDPVSIGKKKKGGQGTRVKRCEKNAGGQLPLLDRYMQQGERRQVQNRGKTWQ